MGKPKGPNQKAKYKALNARLDRYTLLVTKIYEAYNLEAAKIATSVNYDGEKPFSFADYPTTKKRVQDLLNGWRNDLFAVINKGTASEWANSNAVQDMLADKALSYYYGKEHGRRKRKYYLTNSDSLQAFQTRVDKGMNLSQKIWEQSKGYKEDLEAAMSSGIQKGMSAVTLSKRVSKYLVDFDSLRADYKEKYGKETDALNCEYRSMRLARSEINMAYRLAEYERWQQFDFVVGIEIKLSKSHHDRMPHGDICDDLAGKYPKDFKWTGWHPNDMCYAVPILKEEEEFFNDEKGSNEVTDVPESMKTWINKNKSRIEEAEERNTLPYWIRDNKEIINKQKKSVAEIAQERHAKRDDEAILNAWQIRSDMDEYDRKELAKVRRWSNQLGVDTKELESSFYNKDNDAYDVKEILYSLSDKVDDKLNKWTSTLIDTANTLRQSARRYALNDIETEVLDWLTKSEPVPDISYSESIKAMTKFKNKILDKIDRLKVGAVVRPNYIADTFVDLSGWMNSEQKVDNVLSNLERFLGTATVPNEYKDLQGVLLGLKPYENGGIFRSYISKPSSSQFISNCVNNYVGIMNRGAREVMKSINHLDELHRAADLDKIPHMWRKKFNKYVEAIEKHDVSKNGYYGIYHQIEGAYNIYKLSTTQDSVAYGLRRLSVNTPYQLFTEFKKHGLDYTKFETRIISSSKITRKIIDILPKKSFFDTFDEFIPLQTKGVAGHTAYYTDAYKHVVINLDNSLTIGRLKKSAQHAEYVFYHEYGHATDYLKGFAGNKEWQAVYDKYVPKINDLLKNVGTDQFYTTKEYKAIADKMYRSGKYSVDDVTELIGSLEDVFQAMLTDHRKVGRIGHELNYFNSKQAQMTEFIAHCFESYWKGNEAIQLYMPDLYKEMRKLVMKFK